MSDSFLGDLHEAMALVPCVPRVRFECALGEGADTWLRKKHDGGAVHEPATLAAFIAISRRFNSRRIFDLGALYGYFTLFALQAFENAEVTAFDMHPGIVAPLRANVEPWAKCVQCAISDETRENVRVWLSGFNIFEEPDGGWEKLETAPGAMKQRGEDNRGRGWAKIDFITLDDYCQNNPTPDLIKIDVEGYQAKAIAGAMRTIQSHRPAIVIELHDPEKLERFGTTNALTVHPLFDAGYDAYWCGDHRSPDARFERVDAMDARHEKLSLMVFAPAKLPPPMVVADKFRGDVCLGGVRFGI